MADDLDMWWSRRPGPYNAPMSEFATPADLQRGRISAMFGWDVQYPGREFMRRLLTTPLPIGARVGLPLRPTPTIDPSRAALIQESRTAPTEYSGRWVDWRPDPSAGPQTWRPPAPTPRELAYQRALQEFENLPRPPTNRMHTLAPLGLPWLGSEFGQPGYLNY